MLYTYNQFSRNERSQRRKQREWVYIYKIYRSRDCNHASSGTYINDYGRKKKEKQLSDCGIIGITIIAFVHIQISLRAPCKRVGLGFVCCCRPRNYYYFFPFLLYSGRTAAWWNIMALPIFVFFWQKNYETESERGKVKRNKLERQGVLQYKR